jgi:hypothetical protein
MENLEIISKENNFIINKLSKIQNKIIKDIITQKTVKKRNPGVDHVRLIASYNIVLNHNLFFEKIF